MNAAIEKALREYARLKAEEDRLLARKKAAHDTLVAVMSEAGKKTAALDLGDGQKIKGTLVQSSVAVIDGDRLKTAIPGRVWEKVTKRVVDKDKVEAAVALGELDVNVVAACTEVQDRAPYVRVSGDLEAVVRDPGVKRVVRPRRSE